MRAARTPALLRVKELKKAAVSRRFHSRVLSFGGALLATPGGAASNSPPEEICERWRLAGRKLYGSEVTAGAGTVLTAIAANATVFPV